MSSQHHAYISTTELAQFLGISVVAVCKRIQKGQIRAVKIGRSYAIPRSYVEEQYPLFPRHRLPLEEYLSVMEAAELLNVHRMTILARIRNGQLKARRVGRHYVIAKSDLDSASPNDSQIDSDYLSVMQVAEVTGQDRRTIHLAVVQGKIRAHKVGRHYVIAREDIPQVGHDLARAKHRADEYISVAEAAEILSISRIAVFKRIQKGQIPAERMGRSYAIRRSFFSNEL